MTLTLCVFLQGFFSQLLLHEQMHYYHLGKKIFHPQTSFELKCPKRKQAFFEHVMTIISLVPLPDMQLQSHQRLRKVSRFRQAVVFMNLIGTTSSVITLPNADPPFIPDYDFHPVIHSEGLLFHSPPFFFVFFSVKVFMMASV